MADIFCQLCNVNVLVFHMHLHVAGKKHKARQSKETFDQELARTVVLQGFNPDSPLKFNELQEIFQQFGYIEGFRTQIASQEVDVRFYNNRDAKKTLSAGRYVFYRNEKYQIYKKFQSEEDRDEILKCPPPPEISEQRQALLPSPSQGIDPSYASSSQLIQPAHSAHPDAYAKDWKIKYRTEYQDSRLVDRSGADSRGKLTKHELEDRYQTSAYRSNELTDSRYPNSGSQELSLHDSRTMERQVLLDSSYSQRNFKGAPGVQDYRYQMSERNRILAESPNHSVPFHQPDGRDQIMLTESINHLPTLSKYESGFASQAVGRNQIVSASLFHGHDVDDRRSDAIVQSVNNQIYLPDSHYQDLRQPGGSMQSRSRDAVAQVPASRYQTHTDLDSQSSRNTMLDYRRPRDAVEDTHFRSAEDPRNSIPDYNRPRDVIDGDQVRTTQGPRAPIPEYNRPRERPDDGHIRKTSQSMRNSVPDYNRPREVIEDNHIRSIQSLRNSELIYSKPKDGVDVSQNRTPQDSRNLLPDYKRGRDVEDRHRLSEGPRNSESEYKRARDIVEDNHRSTRDPKKSEPAYKRGKDLDEDNHISITQGPRKSEPEYKRARDLVEDNHRSSQGLRNSEPEFKRARDISEDNHRSTLGPRYSELEYKRGRDVEDNYRPTEGSRNPEPEYKRGRDIEDNYRSNEGSRNPEPEYKRGRDIEDNYRSTEGSRNAAPAYKRGRDLVEDSHRSTQGSRNSEPEYKRGRDLVEDTHRLTQGPRNSEPEYKRGRDLVEDDRRSTLDPRNSEPEYKRGRSPVDDVHRSTQGPRNSDPQYKRGRSPVDDVHRSTQGPRNSEPEYKRGRSPVDDVHRSTQGPRNSDPQYKRGRSPVDDVHRSTQGPRNSEPEYKRGRDPVDDVHRSTLGPRNSEPEYKRGRDPVEGVHRSTQGPRNSDPEYKRGRDLVEDNHRSTQGPRNSEPEYKRGRDLVEDNNRSTQGPRNSKPEYKRGRDSEDSHKLSKGPRNSDPEYKRGRDLDEDSRRLTQGARNLEPDFKRPRNGAEDGHSRKSSEGHKNSVPVYSKSRNGVDKANKEKSSHSSRAAVDDYSQPQPREETGNGNTKATERALRPLCLKKTSDTEKKLCPLRIRNPLVKENKRIPIVADPKIISKTNVMLSLDLKGNFDSQMTTFMYELRHFENDSMKINHALSDIERVMQVEYPGCQVLPCGANVTGLFSFEAVVEFYVKFTKENKYKIAGAETIDGRIDKASSRKTAELLARPYKIFAHIRAFTTRSPRVELEHLPTAFAVHLFFKYWTVAKDELLKFLISTDRRLKQVFAFIKYWAAVHLDNMGKGKASKYYLMWLVVFYLQRLAKPILPPIQFLQKDSSHDNFVDGWNLGFNHSLRDVPKNENTSSIKTLLEGFFEFYSEFKFHEVIISPFVGDAIPTRVFIKTDELPPIFDIYKLNLLDKTKGLFQSHLSINVQDPFEHNYNASIHLHSELMNLFQNKCKLTLSHFQDCHRTGTDEGLLNRIFLCDEIINLVENKEMQRMFVPLPMDAEITLNEECIMLTYVRLNKLLANLLTDVLKSKFICAKDIGYNSDGALCSPHAKYTCELFFNLWASRSTNQSKSDSNSIIERETGVSDKIIDSLYRNQKPACPILMFDLDACIKIESKSICLTFTCAETFSETFREFFRICGPIFEQAVKRLAARVAL